MTVRELIEALERLNLPDARTCMEVDCTDDHGHYTVSVEPQTVYRCNDDVDGKPTVYVYARLSL